MNLLLQENWFIQVSYPQDRAWLNSRIEQELTENSLNKLTENKPDAFICNLRSILLCKLHEDINKCVIMFINVDFCIFWNIGLTFIAFFSLKLF